MPTIEIIKQAEFDITDACDWYEEKQQGLSLKFRKALSYKFSLIAASPNLYAKKYGTDLHFAPLSRFPYVVIYWFNADLNTVIITSVFHTKRNAEKFD